MAALEWKDLEFLLGEWDASGGGQPGQGTGTVSFAFELDKKIFTRRNHVDYPATTQAPAFSHDDLLITYMEGTGEVRAIYFDNEGHTIHYSVSRSEAGHIIYLSEAVPAAPRFRMSYFEGENGTYVTRFEIAPPGSPEAFAMYVEGSAKRKTS